MIDAELLLRLVLALLVVLALVLGAARLGRRYFVDGGGAAGAGKRRRLRVVESAAVDGRSRRVGGRGDDLEKHQVLGPTAPRVVETGNTARFGAAL
ncbi:MAG: hypothetical protein ACT4P2_04210, partial [Pseudomonadota bacterium]